MEHTEVVADMVSSAIESLTKDHITELMETLEQTHDVKSGWTGARVVWLALSLYKDKLNEPGMALFYGADMLRNTAEENGVTVEDVTESIGEAGVPVDVLIDVLVGKKEQSLFSCT